MTASGTYTFAPQIDDLLTEAWERCNLSLSLITADVARSARRSVQAMLIDWTGRGCNLWQIEREDTTLTPGIQFVTTPVGTVDVLELWVNVSGSDILLSPISRDEWAGIPNKTYKSRPNQYWIERRLDLPVIHLWPVPDQAYPASINRMRVPQDVSGMAQSADAPLAWTEALYAGLAARMAQKFAPEREDKLMAQAERAFQDAAEENRERVPLTLLPRLVA